MSRNAPRKPTAVQTETPAAAPTPEAPAAVASAPAPALSLGWKVALLVWALGFFGLAGFELINLAWRLARG